MSELIYSTVKFTKNTGSKAGKKENGNVEETSKTADVIYDNFVEPKLEEKSTADQQTIVGSGKKKHVTVVVILGLLSLLLVAVIVLVFQISEDRRNLSKERDELQSSYSQLKELNYNLTQNMSQLETINRNLTREKNELQAQLSKTIEYICTYGNSFGGSCYLFSITRKNWYDSKAECEKLGAHLVIITSEDEQRFIIGKISEIHWIGLTDEEEEGTWKWVNGEQLNTKYWGKNQPDNYQSNEDCATVASSNPLKNWNDLNCKELSRWICEKEINK
ncbi:CD209 antigen-like protein C [Thalassophryne amazonica]|uniref:CD209 antigen-like protein C n=1 Tax=Thalassophryne amazonica TaxID=390379 RepID=UPI0014716D08|nr:CD209 antigen-like protein C [Thalassophryne amazonica]